MTKKYFITIFFFFSCWLGPESPAIQTGYNFDDVGKLLLNIVSDHSNMLGSGAMVSNSLTHNFLKYGYRAARVMGSKSIKKQLKPLWSRLHNEIEKHT